jgi:capsular polysaccharide biosynthesis protein
LRSQAYPELFPAAPSDIWFHDRAGAPALLASEIAAGLNVTGGAPGAIFEIDDVFVVPGPKSACLYDKDGRRIDESCVVRGAERAVEYVESDRERIVIPDHYATVAEPVLFLSTYFKHWGHFLTESTSRLWARSAHPELRELPVCFADFTRKHQANANAAAFLASLSAPPLRFIEPTGPARIAKCFVPAASFVNRRSARAAHLFAAREVAETSLGAARAGTTAQPVYLSRSRLAIANRAIGNERELEEILAKAGVAIVHPQELTLAEQIAVFNRHKTFIGCIGSAFHNTVFALKGGDVTTHVLSQRWRNQNYLMLDAIVGNRANYLSALRRASPSSVTSGVEFQIDMPMAIAYFREAGMI